MTYHIYARTSYDEPLTLFAQLDALDGPPTKEEVTAKLDQYEAETWVEVIIIPEEEMLWARREEGEQA